MTPCLRVEEPGLFTTIQDLGRPHALASGVPPGGAMDRFAHIAANLLVGNDAGAATLECTLRGPRLVALTACVVAVAGADLDLRVNDRPAPLWTAVSLQEGDAVGFGARRSGARSYLAVAGGLAGDRWLGSLSTNVMAGRGGLGRALRRGDELAAGEPRQDNAAARHVVPPDYSDHTLRVIAGPHVHRLSRDSRDKLFTATFTVGPDADRMGYRLDGPPLAMPDADLLSFGLVAGALQLPAGGRPILLMADHQTAGGYPVIAVTVSASMPVAAQLAPGDEVRFAETDIATALRLRADQRAALASLTS